MIIPPYLQNGDRIAIVAPARAVTPDEIQPSIDRLAKEGFDVKPGDHLFRKWNQFAGTDEERLHDLQQALNDQSVKAILFARGGYGCMRIIDRLDSTQLSQNPKWLIGFSDITAFHAWAMEKTGICTVHGPMAIHFKEDEEGVACLLKLIKGISSQLPAGPPSAYNIPGRARGRIVGGNLSMLYALAGSSAMPEGKGNIIFLEDLDEYLYHVDRMIISLIRSNFFKDAAAVVVGGLNAMRDNPVPFGFNAAEIIHHHLSRMDIPVGFDFPSGHLSPNYPLLLNAHAELTVDKLGCALRYTSLT